MALLTHVGGRPSVVQQTLIERACQLQIRIAMMDRDFANGGVQTEHDSRTYLAWSNSLTRTLRELGMNEAPAPTPRWHPPAASPPATRTAAAMARTERLAQRAAELAGAK
jgi:hypothetical protein